MTTSAQSQERCTTLFVTESNILDDSAAMAGQRELLGKLTALGTPCAVVSRLVLSGNKERSAASWLAERGWSVEESAEGQRKDRHARSLRVMADGVSVTLLPEPAAGTAADEESEPTAFLHLVNAALDTNRPDVVLVCAGPHQAAVLSAARSRSAVTVVLQPDCTPRDPGQFRDADVVVTPTRFAADFLREALGIPCITLPPAVPGNSVADLSGRGAVVFDGSIRGNGLFPFLQIANELSRRRPDIPLLFLGGDGTVDLPSGATIRCVVPGSGARVWDSARVCLSLLTSWEKTPFTALSALRHGIPVLSSDEEPAAELLEGAGILLSLPERVTPAVPAPLNADELAPWVETLLRFYDDPAFADRQRGLALLAGARWDAAKLAPQYAQFLAGLIENRRQRFPVSANGQAKKSVNDEAIGRLSRAGTWPAERPEDAAPGEEQGWLGEGTELMLSRVLSPGTNLVVELGAWLGLSTRFIADRAPNARVVSVDHWEGSPEHKTQERFQKLLPRLYETFQARCWNYRDRVKPLRMSTVEGLRAVADAGLQPDFVYVDAEHSFDAVTTELTLARQLFPRAELGGDDYDWRGVREAVDTFARRHGLLVDRFGRRGWRLLESWRAGEATNLPPGRGQYFVLVPHMNGIEWECEQALRWLEGAGVRVVRRGGCSAIDVARNEMISDALHNEAESILFIDSDIGFDPQDALRLLARPEPVIGGVYAKKGVRELASVFTDEVKEIRFGPEAIGPYPAKYAATGFLRIRAGVLWRMIEELGLPLCNTHWGRGVWPFFQPMIVPHGPGKYHYLGEDWAFSHRLGQIGVTPLADTSIRLWHWGRYGFSWEDAGTTVSRYRTYTYHLANT